MHSYCHHVTDRSGVRERGEHASPSWQVSPFLSALKGTYFWTNLLTMKFCIYNVFNKPPKRACVLNALTLTCNNTISIFGEDFRKHSSLSTASISHGQTASTKSRRANAAHQPLVCRLLAGTFILLSQNHHLSNKAQTRAFYVNSLTQFLE